LLLLFGFRPSSSTVGCVIMAINFQTFNRIAVFVIVIGMFLIFCLFRFMVYALMPVPASKGIQSFERSFTDKILYCVNTEWWLALKMEALCSSETLKSI
jgi:hypothetical protein